MKVQIREILENFPDLLNLVRGTPDQTVSDLQTGTTASSASLIFVSNRAQLMEAQDSKAQAWVIGKDLVEQVPPSVKTVLSSPNPYLALALVAKRLFPQTRHHLPIGGPPVHATAQVSPRA